MNNNNNNNNKAEGNYMQQEEDSILQEQFRQNVSELFDSPELSDIEFIFPDHRSIKAHRFVLFAASEHLKTELRSTWQCVPRVSITSHPYPVFHLYLFYLYTHTLSTEDIDQLVSLAHLAHHYHELHLQQLCARHLSAQLNLDNCCRVFELAVDLQLEQVEAQASEMIVQNMALVRVTDDFKNMSKEKILKLLNNL